MKDRLRDPLYCGIDVGASSTKLVLLNEDREIRGISIRRSGVDYAATARACLVEAIDAAEARAGQVRRTVSTGYGRRNVDFADDARTELSCHGVGCYHHFPSAITIVDIGCQDNKIIRLDDTGRRIDFKMNRKCAAGTGAFLEEIALRLDIRPEDLEELASSTDKPVRLNSFCTVFASTEILSHLRRGEPLADLVRGAFVSVISRVAEMDRLHGVVVLTGGVVAHNPTTAAILEDKLKSEVKVPPNPQFTGALGAALIALEQEENTHA
ncbi:MAG: acyl-CoA dehydratase activase [Thermoanaerobaculales bacterium]